MWITMLLGAKNFLAANWKIVGLGALALFVYWKGTNWYEEYQEAKAAEEGEMVRLALEKQAAELSAQSMQGTLLLMMEEKRKQELLFMETLRRMDEAKVEADKQIDTFEEHDFPALVEAKPGLIEKLANRATAERMKEIQDALND